MSVSLETAIHGVGVAALILSIILLSPPFVRSLSVLCSSYHIFHLTLLSDDSRVTSYHCYVLLLLLHRAQTCGCVCVCVCSLYRVQSPPIQMCVDSRHTVVVCGVCLSPAVSARWFVKKKQYGTMYPQCLPVFPSHLHCVFCWSVTRPDDPVVSVFFFLLTYLHNSFMSSSSETFFLPTTHTLPRERVSISWLWWYGCGGGKRGLEQSLGHTPATLTCMMGGGGLSAFTTATANNNNACRQTCIDSNLCTHGAAVVLLLLRLLWCVLRGTFPREKGCWDVVAPAAVAVVAVSLLLPLPPDHALLPHMQGKSRRTLQHTEEGVESVRIRLFLVKFGTPLSSLPLSVASPSNPPFSLLYLVLGNFTHTLLPPLLITEEKKGCSAPSSSSWRFQRGSLFSQNADLMAIKQRSISVSFL